MISLRYSCSCSWASPILDEAQDHADSTGHIVKVDGSITARKDVVGLTSKMDASEALKLRARNAEILRRARDKGLLK